MSSTGVVRAWVCLYTAGLRDSRRDEIDADLWEQAVQGPPAPRP